MKYTMPSVLATAVLAATFGLRAFAENAPPGQVDFGTFSPSASGGEFVEVNLSSNLISMAAQFIQKSEPDVAKLLTGLHQVRVNVIGLDDENRVDLEKRVRKVRRELDSKGWERVVTALEKNQDVGVYLKTANKDTIQGLAVIVLEGKKEAVFVNIVGNIKPEQLAMVGERLHIEPLKHLEKATGHSNEDKPEEKAEEK